MISLSPCLPWQPDPAGDAAQEQRSYTTRWDMIVAGNTKGLAAANW
jgi:hypothetical protein